MLLCDLIGEAVPKIQGRWMDALSPISGGKGDAARLGGRDGLDFETEPVDQARHFLSDIPAGRDDESFRHCGCGDQKVVPNRLQKLRAVDRRGRGGCV